MSSCGANGSRTDTVVNSESRLSHTQAVIFAEFILQPLVHVADADFPEKFSLFILVLGQKLSCLFFRHADTVVGNVDLKNRVIFPENVNSDRSGCSLWLKAMKDRIFHDRL